MFCYDFEQLNNVFVQVDHNPQSTPQKDFPAAQGSWLEASPANVGSFSAVCCELPSDSGASA